MIMASFFNNGRELIMDSFQQQPNPTISVSSSSPAMFPSNSMHAWNNTANASSLSTPVMGALVQPICEICFQVCNLPVKITCFPCYNPATMHCHSIKRFCYGCARRFLELDTPRMERSDFKKCLYCNLTVKLHTLRSSECMEKDFFIMSLDTSRHACIYQGCDFKGTPNELNRHMTRCEYMLKRCRGCSEQVLMKDMETHISTCEGRIQCPECRSFILEETFNRHLLHRHALKSCKYCHEIVPVHQLNDHLELNCTYKPVACEYCQDVYSGEDELGHLCQHLTECSGKDVELLIESHRLKKQIQEIREKISAL